MTPAWRLGARVAGELISSIAKPVSPALGKRRRQGITQPPGVTSLAAVAADLGTPLRPF